MSASVNCSIRVTITVLISLLHVCHPILQSWKIEKNRPVAYIVLILVLMAISDKLFPHENFIFVDFCSKEKKCNYVNWIKFSCRRINEHVYKYHA